MEKSNEKKYNVAIVGATGAVGAQLLKVLAERQFPVGNLILLASARSEGKTIDWQGQTYTVHEARPKAFEGVDIVLFAGGNISKTLAPEAVKRGAVCIDNSSTFRYDPEVPLVVPEVNPEDVRWHKGIIANPNCSTIQMVVALKPIYDNFGLKRVVVATYQAVSGAGKEGLDELEAQIQDVAAGRKPQPATFQHQIACNLIPHIDIFLDNDYTKEEMKMVNETVKIMGDANIRVTATCVRVPVFYGHSESVNIETARKMTPQEARAILAQAPGVQVYDNPGEKMYPMAIDAAGEDDTFVGRIREDETIDNGLNMWIVADNIRKGAALNAVQIAEELLRRDLLGVGDRNVFERK